MEETTLGKTKISKIKGTGKMLRGIRCVQRKIRQLLSCRYNFTLLLTFFKMSTHIDNVNGNHNELEKIFDEYFSLFDGNHKIIISSSKYCLILNKILNLRKKAGGYLESIYVDHKIFKLFDRELYWNYFFLNVFNSEKIERAEFFFTNPCFTITETKDTTTLEPNIQYKWKNEVVNGFFKQDTLGIISLIPILNYEYDKFNMSLIKWVRFFPIPLYLKKPNEQNYILEKFIFYNTKFKNIADKPITEITSIFVSSNILEKFSYIYFFGLSNEKHQFVAILLYMLLRKEFPENARILLRKLPIQIRIVLINASDITEDKLSDYSQQDDEKTYEVKICLLNAPKQVKQKALEKLKEIQNKLTDISKPQHYLDKLLSIPFGVYRKEALFEETKMFFEKTKSYVTRHDIDISLNSWYELKDFFQVSNEILILYKVSKEDIILLIKACKSVLKLKSLQYKTQDGIKHTVICNKRKIPDSLFGLKQYVENASPEIKDCISTVVRNLLKNNEYYNLAEKWMLIKKKMKIYPTKFLESFNSALYGQENAKQAISNIMCEWITGSYEGYCFGFDGPPGVGKTSFAKHGLAKCLVDSNGDSRPFIFIGLGGMSHGSTLEGHGYTYASATCGSIINSIIMAKCLNPIIFFDELDKVSKTDQGQEIIGLLMHMTDPVQNCEFKDKFFEGIPIDLSKALIIFSYNDVSKIDTVLKERIHSIKFNSFSTHDKICICNNFILPSFIKRLGLPEDKIILSNDVLCYIIENFTHEAGVRKIKQVLLHIYREINKRLMSEQITLPIRLTKNILEFDLLKDFPLIHAKKISQTSQIGLVNGLFALSSGGGGIIQISAKSYQSLGNSSDGFETTGQLGNIMKESVKVAKTAVCNILKDDFYERHLEKIKSKKFDFHLHCSENGTPKDGPSAGVAIFFVLLSTMIQVPVKNNVAFTGEIDLTGNIGIIGGISDKLKGAYDAGVKTVFCPFENKADVLKIDACKETWMTKIQVVYVKHVLDDNIVNQCFTESVTHFLKNTYSS